VVLTQLKTFFTELKGVKTTLYSITVLTLHKHQHKTFIQHSFFYTNSKWILNKFFLVPKSLKKYRFIDLPSKKSREKIKEKNREGVHAIVKRKSKDDPIFDERNVKNNDIDYRLPIDSSNLDCAATKPSNFVAHIKSILIIKILIINDSQ